MGDNWSRQEVEAIVTDYLGMLTKELRGEPINKAEHNRRLQTLLPNRSRGSIEFKHANISAVLIELGYPYVDGYKPRRNYQDLLREVIEVRVGQAVTLRQEASRAVDEPVGSVPLIEDLLAIQVAPPAPEEERRTLREHRQGDRKSPQGAVNYLERENRNRSLGLAGEELVLRFEHERLWREGRKDLARRIDHVSQTRGDYVGFDVESFERDGQPRLIEVKTTRFGALTPFFATRNEVAVSEERSADYHLYRVHKFHAAPRLFVLSGSLRDTCDLDPIQYVARVA